MFLEAANRDAGRAELGQRLKGDRRGHYVSAVKGAPADRPGGWVEQPEQTGRGRAEDPGETSEPELHPGAGASEPTSNPAIHHIPAFPLTPHFPQDLGFYLFLSLL